MVNMQEARAECDLAAQNTPKQRKNKARDEARSDGDDSKGERHL